MSSEVKIISIGDYVKDVDNIITIPVMQKSQVYNVELRIKKPMAEHSHRIMNLLAETFGDRLESLANRGEITNIMTLPLEERKEVLLFSWLNSATLISSCCYHPDRNEDGTPIDDPRRIWETADEVGKQCPKDLFDGIRSYLEGVGIDKTVSEIEAKK